MFKFLHISRKGDMAHKSNFHKIKVEIDNICNTAKGTLGI